MFRCKICLEKVIVYKTGYEHIAQHDKGWLTLLDYERLNKIRDDDCRVVIGGEYVYFALS